MSSIETEAIKPVVSDLQHRDFSRVAQDLQQLQKQDSSHFQQNVDAINKSVDFKSLGFPANFKIDGLDKSGAVHTSNDASWKGAAAGDHSASSSIHAADAKPGTFTQNADGSQDYKVKAGDNLTSIARNALHGQNGEKTPTNAEVAAEVQKIAKANGIHNANRIGVGQELHIPGKPPEVHAPSANADSPALAPENGVSTPLAVPGLQPESPNDTSDRKVTSTQHADQQTTRSYSGSVESNHVYQGATDYTAQRTTDDHGNLISSDVKYGNHTFGANGTEISIGDGKGGTQKIQATEVKTDFNSKTGNYDSTITAADGSTYNVTSDSNGKVLSSQKQEAAAAAAADPRSLDMDQTLLWQSMAF